MQLIFVGLQQNESFDALKISSVRKRKFSYTKESDNYHLCIII